MKTIYTVLIALSIYIPRIAAGNELQFLAGAAVADVTPQESVPMWGYGSRHAALSKGTLDPLKATAIVLQVGKEKLAIVGLDLGRSPSEESLQRIRERIKSQAGIAHSMIAGSHTHHGPVLELSDKPGRGQGKYDAAIRYYQQMEDAIVDAIVRASQQLTAVKIATASKDLDGFNRNRHSKIQPTPLDRQLAVMKLESIATGKVIAVLVNFASRSDLNNPLIRTVYSVAFFPELVANFVDEYKEGIRPRMTVVLLNDQIALVGASGEFFCQHAIGLRERARVEQLFFCGYCNGYHQYFPTIQAAAEGGYGADSQVAPAEVGAGEKLVNQALEWIFRMQGKL